MDTFFIILLVICSPIYILAFIAWIRYLFLSKKKKNEFNKQVDSLIKQQYPDYPNIKRPKTHFASFPLNLWNDPD